LRLWWTPVLLLLPGCQRPTTAAYVDLSKIPADTIPIPKGGEVGITTPTPLSGDQQTLPRLEGAQVSMGQTAERVRAAKALIQKNREQALKGLTSALYRAYSREAEAESRLREQDLTKASEAMWDAAFGKISALLKEHAGDRAPLANRLAFLIGFPFRNPKDRPRPENKVDAKAYDEAVVAWQKLLAEDREFAARVQAILEQVQAGVDDKKVDQRVAFTRALNAAADRSRSEANQAVSSKLPEFVGTLSERADVRIPSTPEKTVSLGPVPPIATTTPRSTQPQTNLRLLLLEQDLKIWLAQNGYVRAKDPSSGRDRTQEFADWLKARRAGL